MISSAFPSAFIIFQRVFQHMSFTFSVLYTEGRKSVIFSVMGVLSCL